MNNASILAGLFLAGLTLGDRRILVQMHSRDGDADSINAVADIIMVQLLEMTGAVRKSWIKAIMKYDANVCIGATDTDNPVIGITHTVKKRS